MKKDALNKVKFVCPTCQKDLKLGKIFSEENGDVLEGILTCSAGHEFPIVDGVAILVKDPSAYVKEKMQFIVCREDLNPYIFDVLQEPIQEQRSEILWINTFLWAHYDDFSDEDAKTYFPSDIFSPRNTYTRLAAHIPQRETMGIDIGCSVGRLTFELAQRVKYAFGIDYSFTSVKKAREIMKSGVLVYRKRKEGTLFHEERKVDLSTVVTSNVEFFVADAMNLPFADNRFGVATCFNVIDVIESPEKLLTTIKRILDIEGSLVLADPYHWIFTNTKRENWIGGKYSGEYSGLSKDAVKAALKDQGFVIDSEEDEIPWLLRNHDRAYGFYRIHLLEAHKVVH